jgi:hypothetical protein
MTHWTIRRHLLVSGLTLALPAVVLGCPKKQTTPPVEDAGIPTAVSAPTVTELAPLVTDDAGPDVDAEAGPKKWTGAALNPNQQKIEACCNGMRAQAKTMGQSSPEAFQLNAFATQCDVLAKQIGPQGTAPEFAQIRQMLKSVKLPSACNF